MFFHISQNKNNNFPNCIKLNQTFFANLDDDWQIINDEKNLILFKGLIGIQNLNIESIKKEKEGSYTAIVVDNDNNIHILHDQFRSYPLFYNKEKKIITNLYQENMYGGNRYELEKIYSDNVLQINEKGEIIINQNNIEYNIPTEKHSLNDAVYKINELLNKSISAFCDTNKKPIKIPITGGVDSLLIYSILKNKKINFEILDFEHKEWDYFLRQNFKDILKTSKQFIVSSIWKDQSNVVANGHYGDQIFMREVWLLILFCRLNDINYNDIKDNFKSSYNYEFFVKQEKLLNKELTKECYSIDKNKIIGKMFSFLHAVELIWHINKTYYWTPLKNLQIFKIILNLNTKDFIDNAFNCTIQRRLIELNCPETLDLLSDKKNWNNWGKVLEHIKKEKKQ